MTTTKKLLIVLLLGWCQVTFAQVKNIAGTVTDENGEGLAGVSVKVQANSTNSMSGEKGRFEIKASVGDVLEFSMLGMKPEQATVAASNEINVRLTPDDLTFGDVIITALGRKRERLKLGYSAQNLTGEDLSNTGESNLVNALNGKLAGVYITPAGGGAGAARRAG